MVDTPGDDQINGHGVQSSLVRLQAQLLDLTPLLQHSEKQFSLPPTPIPLHHCTGTREICHGQTRE
jgi:hypothetical protein